jgi:hypothetical protein
MASSSSDSELVNSFLSLPVCDASPVEAAPAPASAVAPGPSPSRGSPASEALFGGAALRRLKDGAALLRPTPGVASVFDLPAEVRVRPGRRGGMVVPSSAEVRAALCENSLLLVELQWLQSELAAGSRDLDFASAIVRTTERLAENLSSLGRVFDQVGSPLSPLSTVRATNHSFVGVAYVCVCRRPRMRGIWAGARGPLQLMWRRTSAPPSRSGLASPRVVLRTAVVFC